MNHVAGTVERFEGRTHAEADAEIAATGAGPDAVLSAAFFVTGSNGRRRFIPSRLGNALAEQTPFAVGGEALHVYRGGAYRPDGEAAVRKRIAWALGEDWKRGHAEDVVAYLYATAERLSDEPPPDRINFANGVFNRATGELEPHDPELLSPLQLAATFDLEAECPEVERFLGEIQPDPDIRRILWELIGYVLISDPNRLQTATMFLGPGANGKSTLINLIRALVGQENVSAIPLHQLEVDRFATSGLYGKLVNTFADLDARALSSSSMFKAITGGDPVQAERKFRNSFTFTPYTRLIFSANEPPPTPDGSDAFFRRWLIIPFERSFEGNEDRDVLSRITTPAELSGLANLGLSALANLTERGRFPECETTAAAKEKFRVDSDSVRGFLAECCRVELDEQTAKPALYRAYRERLCSENNRQALSAMRFNRRLEALHGDQLDLKTIQGTETWQGIGLTEGL